MRKKEKYSHIIWDWNGTLFDDVNWSLSVINKMLASRDMKVLEDVEAYRNVFCFPIIDYYKNVGLSFEEESFEQLANEFITLYHSAHNDDFWLHDQATFVLETIHKEQISQVILSASEIGYLTSQVNSFDITHYFDDLLGLSDVYAKSKVDVGIAYLSEKKIERALLIGDTEHDFEVAEALGAECVLIANGHQSKERLQSCNVPVLEEVSQVVDFIV